MPSCTGARGIFANAKVLVPARRHASGVRAVVRGDAGAGQHVVGPARTGLRFLLQDSWDPVTFVDLVEVSVGRRSWSEVFCRSVQQSEWRLLFAYCFQQAIGEAV